MPVHAHDRRIDHLNRRIMSGGQRIHDPVPDACPPPADEAIVASRGRSIALRQIAPRCARSQDPEDAIEDTPVVYAGNAARFVREHRSDNAPLIIAEFVPHDSRLQFGSLNHAHGNNINSKPVFPKLPGHRTCRGHGLTDANDPGCVKTLETVVRMEEKNRTCDLGESLMRERHSFRINLAPERPTEWFSHSQDPSRTKLTGIKIRPNRRLGSARRRRSAPTLPTLGCAQARAAQVNQARQGHRSDFCPAVALMWLNIRARNMDVCL